MSRQHDEWKSANTDLRRIALRDRDDGLRVVGFEPRFKSSHSRITGGDPIHDANDAVFGNVPAGVDTRRCSSRHGNPMAGGLLSAHQRRHLHEGAKRRCIAPGLDQAGDVSARILVALRTTS
jgi:hypothetical protein